MQVEEITEQILLFHTHQQLLPWAEAREDIMTELMSMQQAAVLVVDHHGTAQIILTRGQHYNQLVVQVD